MEVGHEGVCPGWDVYGVGCSINATAVQPLSAPLLIAVIASRRVQLPPPDIVSSIVTTVIVADCAGLAMSVTTSRVAQAVMFRKVDLKDLRSKHPFQISPQFIIICATDCTILFYNVPEIIMRWLINT